MSKRPAPTRKVPLFAGRQQGVVKTDGRGDQTVIPFTGDPTTALLGDGTFGPIASGGDVSGPGSSDPVTDGHFAQWDGTDGQHLKDGGYSPASFDAAGVAAGLVATEAGTRAAADTALAAPDYLVKTATATLSAERVVTDNTDITADWSVAGVVKFLLGAFTGDITKAAGSLATAIGANKVLDTMLRQSAGVSVIGRSANSTGNVADITAGADHRFLTRRAGALSWEQVDVSTADITGTLPVASEVARVRMVKFTFPGSPVGTIARQTCPVSGTIVRIRIYADVAGLATVDLWKDVWNNYPPVVGDSIVNTGSGGVKPTLSGPSDHSEDTTLAHYTTSVTAGDVIFCSLDTLTTATEINVEVWIQE